jgi:hypothetical protein
MARLRGRNGLFRFFVFWDPSLEDLAATYSPAP